MCSRKISPRDLKNNYRARVADPYIFNADPDPELYSPFQLNADPDPALSSKCQESLTTGL